MPLGTNELGPDEHDRKWEQLKVGKQFWSGDEAQPRGKRAGEYVGVGGLIQPSPHDVANNAYEQLWLIRNMDPAAREDEPDAVELPIPEPQLCKPGSKGMVYKLGPEVKGK